MNVSKVVLVAVLLSGCSPQQRPSPAPDPGNGGYTDAQEGEFYRIINRFRGELRLPGLAPDARLNTAARAHSRFMSDLGYLTHVGPTLTGSSYTRAVEAGIDPEAPVGENIARGHRGARETFLQWLGSPGHLRGMIDEDYDHIGIARSACATETEEDCFWTTDFAQLLDREVPARLITPGEIARAAESAIGPLGGDPDEVSLDEDY